MKITLRSADDWSFLLVAETGRTRSIRTDADFPLVATAFGWQSCGCGQTDGTTDCEHKTATEMTWEAYDWLETHIGETVDDPGYF